MIKRLLALLLCLSLLLPVFAFAEDYGEGDGTEGMIVEDIDGDFISDDDDRADFSDAEIFAIEEAMVFGSDEEVDLKLNTNLPTDEWLNILLLGLDVRGTKEIKLLKDQQGKYSTRADVQIILSINQYDGSMKLTSISRNTEVSIPVDGRSKSTIIANSYGYAVYQNNEYHHFVETPNVCMATVNYNFGMNIEHYAAINYYGVASIIEFLGGVDLELTKAEAKAINTFLSMKNIYQTDSSGNKVKVSHGKQIANTYDDKNGVRDELKVMDGVQHLDGIQALIYARTRKIDNDYQRTGRTRKLLSALLKKAVEKIKSGEIDIMQFLNLIPEYFIVDKNMNLEYMWGLAKIFLRSDIVNNMESADSLVEEFRIPMDGSCYDPYRTGESSISMERFKKGKKQENLTALQEFIYGFDYGTIY